jgi:hypothetical protein
MSTIFTILNYFLTILFVGLILLHFCSANGCQCPCPVLESSTESIRQQNNYMEELNISGQTADPILFGKFLTDLLSQYKLDRLLILTENSNAGK